jgi:hypothetical protein
LEAAVMMTCQTVTTLGGAFALDLLPPEEADAVAVHIASCVTCGERSRARQQSGEWLAHLVAPEPLPAGLRRRLQLRLQDVPRPQPRETAPLSPVAPPAPRPATRAAARPQWLWLLGAALTALLVWNVMLQGEQRTWAESQRQAREVQARLEARLQRQSRVKPAPPAPVRLSRLQGSRRFPAAAGTLAWQSEGGRWTLAAQGLPLLPAGQVFQLWAGGGDHPVPILACRPGSAVMAVPVPAHGALRPGTPLLLTMESGAARERPTGELVLLGLVAD